MKSKDTIFNSISLKMPKYNTVEQMKLKELKNDDRLYGLPPIVIDILYNRGLRSVEDIERHLYSTIKDVPSPILLKDADKFVIYTKEAIDNKEHIVFYTDYDMDGIGAGAIGVNGLRHLGAKVDYYTNNRFIEGYGITPAGVIDLQKKFPDVKLIITTDNGIMGFEGIKKATELGIKVIVTDHHEPSKDGIPSDALAVIDPKREDCQYPFKGLCGAGIIFKLLLLLYFEYDVDLNFMYGMLDILAMSTVGDMVPLLEENRIYVKEGIKMIAEEHKMVFTKLREALELSQIDEEVLGFQYCPMFNSIGRIDGSPDMAIELLITEDENLIEESVNKLIEINNKRKDLTSAQEEKGIRMIEDYIKKNHSLPNVIVLHDDEFHEGIVGLIAGRLKDKYNRPVVVLATHKKNILNTEGLIEEITIYKGSARGIDGFPIKKSFDKIKDKIIAYGGHEKAGGLSIEPSKLVEFTEAINDLAEKTLTKDKYIRTIFVDAPLKTDEITVDLIRQIERLKPFGVDFAKPRFGLSNFKLHPVKNDPDKIICGKNKTTLRLISQDNLTLIMFKFAERYKEIKNPLLLKAVGYPTLNFFNGTTSAQFQVENNYIFNPSY